VLFNASVMDNIRIGKRSATDEEVMRAAQLAQCDEFVHRMPQGYHTVIGENGDTLSGGRGDPETLLQSYSVVFQDVVLFNASVMDNIRIGKRSATDEEVMRAAQLAHSIRANFIRRNRCK
ncbi:hypothetical protein QE152_g41545, partial [Popillia japonica]